MDVELRLTSLNPPEGDARLSGDADVRAFVGWLGLLHMLWELFGETDAPPPASETVAPRPLGERET